MEGEEQTEEQPFKYWFIMRGIPGSGKSTVAKRIAGEHGVRLNYFWQAYLVKFYIT